MGEVQQSVTHLSGERLQIGRSFHIWQLFKQRLANLDCAFLQSDDRANQVFCCRHEKHDFDLE